MRNAVFIPLTYAFLAFLSAGVFFEIVFDDSYDGLISSMSAGQFTGFSLMDQHYLGVLIVRDFYKLVQDAVPRVNVFASFYILSNAFSLLYTLLTLQRTVLNGRPIWVLHAVLLSVSLLFVENIVSITHTRYATVFAGMALLNLGWGKSSRKHFALHFAMFLFGMLNRPESGIGMLMVTGAAHLIDRRDLLLSIRRFLPPALPILILICVFYIHRAHTDRFEIKMEPDTEYAFSTGRVVPLSSMTDGPDSLRYEMATTGMFIDTSFVSIDFMKGIHADASIPKTEDLLISAGNIISLYLYYPAYGVAFLLMFLLALAYRESRPVAYKIVLLHAFVFVLMVVLDFGVTLADRHFSGIHQVTLAIQLLIFMRTAPVFSNRAKPAVLLVSGLLLAVSVSASVYNGLGNQRQVAMEVECQQSAMERIDSAFSSRTVVITIASFHLMDRKYSFFNENYSNNRYIMYDITNYSIVPRNLKYLSGLCSCNASDPLQFMRWLAVEEALIVSSRERQTLVKSYMKLIRNTSIDFQPVISDDELIPECLRESVHDGYQVFTVKFPD
jgi:hypothetical protein